MLPFCIIQAAPIKEKYGRVFFFWTLLQENTVWGLDIIAIYHKQNFIIKN
jgi:hypothetical protein